MVRREVGQRCKRTQKAYYLFTDNLKGILNLKGKPLGKILLMACVQAGVLPVVHGSALGQQGLSQVLVTSTIGDDGSAAKSEGITGELRQQLMVQLNARVAAATEVRSGPFPMLHCTGSLLFCPVCAYPRVFRPYLCHPNAEVQKHGCVWVFVYAELPSLWLLYLRL